MVPAKQEAVSALCVQLVLGPDKRAYLPSSYWNELFRFAVPFQRVDATPSSRSWFSKVVL